MMRVFWNTAYSIRYGTDNEFNPEDNTEEKWRDRFEFLRGFIKSFLNTTNKNYQYDYLKEVKLVNFLVRDLVKGEMFHEQPQI